MTIEQFQQLCKITPVGTTLTFRHDGQVVKGRFVGCGHDEIVIESDDKQIIWPRELCDVRKSDYPIPSYA